MGEFKHEHEREIHVALLGTIKCLFEIYEHKIYEAGQYSGLFVCFCLAIFSCTRAERVATIRNYNTIWHTECLLCVKHFLKQF